MKLMFTHCCGSLVVPCYADRVARWCACQTSACWWQDIARGHLVVFSHQGAGAVSGIALHNGLLAEPVAPIGCVQRARLRELIDESPALFKYVDSMVVKYRPGFTVDCRFEPDPSQIPEATEIAHIERRAKERCDNVETGPSLS
jgi:hypothetical protein